MKMSHLVCVCLPLTIGFSALSAFAVDTEVVSFNQEDIKWGPAPANLPEGAQLAVLEGDPAKEGPFTMRLKAPAGYMVPEHIHRDTERVTIISGEMHLRTHGQKHMKTLAQGGFLIIPAMLKHEAHFAEETVIQVSGIGPWSIEFVGTGGEAATPGTGRQPQ